MKKILIVVESRLFAKVLKNFVHYLGLSVRVHTPAFKRIDIGRKSADVIILDAHGSIDTISSAIEKIHLKIPKMTLIGITATKNSKLWKALGKRASVISMTERDSLLRFSHVVRRSRQE